MEQGKAIIIASVITGISGLFAAYYASDTRIEKQIIIEKKLLEKQYISKIKDLNKKVEKYKIKSNEKVIEYKIQKCKEETFSNSKHKNFYFQYIELYKKYIEYFKYSISDKSLNYAISDEVVKRIIRDAFHINDNPKNEKNVIYYTLPPYNYASLFRNQLGFFDHRYCIPKIKDDKFNYDRVWEAWSDDSNPIDSIYYETKKEIKIKIRNYLKNPSNLNSFYLSKKNVIKNTFQTYFPEIKESKLLDEMIVSFKFILQKEYRVKLEHILSIEKKYSLSRGKGNWDKPESPLEKKLNEEISIIYKLLDKDIPDMKSFAFAYRRYREGNVELVKMYINILQDIKKNLS